MAAMKLSESFWREILRIVVYHNNCSLSQKKITPYENENEEKPNPKNLRVIDSQAWVYVPRKLRKKLTDKV